MDVVCTVTATLGVWRAYEYLFEFNPRAARHLAASIFAAGDSLTKLPRRGRPVRGTTMRELVAAHPYIIRYRISGQKVIFLRVRHSARRPTTP